MQDDQAFTGSVSYTIDEARRLIVLRVRATPTIDEAETLLVSAFSDRRRRPGDACLIDRTGADQPSLEYIQAVASVISRHIELLRPSCAAIVVSGPAAVGVFSMLPMYVGTATVPFEVFTSVAEAEAWIERTRKAT